MKPLQNGALHEGGSGTKGFVKCRQVSKKRDLSPMSGEPFRAVVQNEELAEPDCLNLFQNPSGVIPPVSSRFITRIVMHSVAADRLRGVIVPLKRARWGGQ